MGLDMTLKRAPRYKNTTIKQINTIEGYLDWKDDKDAQKYSLKQWCGVSKSDLPSQDVIDYYKQFYTLKYYYWDTEKEYGRNHISEYVGDWRKANAIHKWFVDNVQDGEDDCGYYEVEKEDLERLLSICKHVKEKCKLVDGKIFCGTRYENGESVDMYEDGKVIENASVAAEYLPTQSGFFFGSTDYDEYYLYDIDQTIKILTNVLETTDFDNQMVVYTSSW